MENEKGNAANVTSIKNLNHNHMKNYKLNKIEFQPNSAKTPKVFQTFPVAATKSIGRKLSHLPVGLRSLVCDECCAPLHLYGENFIESYAEGQANILRCFCDLCAAELEVCK